MQKNILSLIGSLKVSRKNQLLNICVGSTRHYATKEESEKFIQSWETVTNKKKSYAQTVIPKFTLIPETLQERIESSAQERPDELCYVFPHNGDLKFTFKELKQRVEVMSQNLLNLGFTKGDRIAFVLPNTSELAVGALACANIGCIAVILNLGYQAFEIEYMLKKTGAKGFVIYDSFRTLKHLDIITQLCPEITDSAPGELKSSKLPDLKHIFVINSPFSSSKQSYRGTWSYDQLSNPIPGNKKVELPYVDPDDPCFILFTVNRLSH
jgi:acyl-coenzyme A synthetase/AMP-(fatty) acid ligase